MANFRFGWCSIFYFRHLFIPVWDPPRIPYQSAEAILDWGRGLKFRRIVFKNFVVDGFSCCTSALEIRGDDLHEILCENTHGLEHLVQKTEIGMKHIL